MGSRKTLKRQRPDDKERAAKKRPPAKATASAPASAPAAPSESAMKALASMRHVMLRVADGELVDAFVARTGAKDVVIIHDAAATASDIITAASKSGEIADARDAELPEALAGTPAEAGSSASDWAAVRVRFETKGAFKKLLALGVEPKQSGEDGEPVGMALWVKEAEDRIPRSSTLTAEVDSAMAAFEASERGVEKEMRAIAGKPDADGFITVVPKSKSKGAGRIARGASAGPDAWGFVSQNRKNKNRRGAAEASDFYGFQTRERRINELEDLRRKFEADKERVQKMRKSRVFRPV